MGAVVVGGPGAPVVAQSGDSDRLAGKLFAALGAVDDGIVAAGSGAGGGDLVLDHGLARGVGVSGDGQDDRAGLGGEGLGFKDRRVDALPLRGRSGLDGDGVGRGDGFGHGMGGVVRADGACRHGGAIGGPLVGRLAPVVTGGRDDDVLLIVVVVVGVDRAAGAVAAAKSVRGAGGLLPVVGNVGIGVGVGGAAVIGVVRERGKEGAGVGIGGDLHLQDGIGIHEVRLGELGCVADETLLVEVELVRQLVARQIVPAAAEGVALGDLNQKLDQNLQAVGGRFADAVLIVAVLAEAFGVAVPVALGDAGQQAGSLDRGGLIVAVGLVCVVMTAVVDVDLAPAEDLAGVVTVGVLAGDADELAQQGGHIARGQVLAGVILAGGGLHVRGVVGGGKRSRASVAGEAPFRHRKHGNEVVAVDEVEDAVILGGRCLGVRRVVGGREGVGEDGEAVVDQIGGDQVGDSRAAGVTGGPIDQLLALQTVQHGLNVGCVVADEVFEDAGGGHVEAAMVGLARPVLVGLAGRLAGGSVVLVEEAGQVADVEVGAPFLNGIAVRAADPEGDDDLRLTVIDRGAVADEDLAEIVVGIDGIEREIHHVLKAEDLQKLNATGRRSR